MPSASNTYSPELLDQLVSAVDFRSASVTFSCKVSIKEGDCYRGVESGITVSMRVQGLEGMPHEVVRLAALKHMPMLASKVYTDLALGDVMTPTEAQERIKKASEFYTQAYQSLLERHGREHMASSRLHNGGDLESSQAAGSGDGSGGDSGSTANRAREGGDGHWSVD